MKMGAWIRGIWAGCALLSALAIAPAQAAPLSRTDTASADTPDDITDTRPDSSSAASFSQPQATGAQDNNSLGKPPSAPDRDFGRSVREVSKPLLEELAHSDVAEAVRALNTKPDAVDSGLVNPNQESEGRDPPTRKREWDGTGQRQASENNISQTSNRDPARDKARAALLMSGLIDEIKPWAVGAVVLYVLGYIAKFSFAARRRTVQRRIERRKHRSRKGQNSQSSQHGRL